MRVCAECGWRFEDERTTCLICGGEVVPSQELFLPPPQPLRSYLAWFSRRLQPLRHRFRKWVEEADVADASGGGFMMWWQDLRYDKPWVIALIALSIAAVFAALALAPTLYDLLREWLRHARG